VATPSEANAWSFVVRRRYRDRPNRRGLERGRGSTQGPVSEPLQRTGGQSAHVCAFTPRVSRAAEHGNFRSRSAEVSFTRRTLNSNYYLPLRRRRQMTSTSGASRSSSSCTRYVVDNRNLPLPEPFDKHQPHPSRNQRLSDNWTWSSWETWTRRAWTYRWRKRSLRRVLELRDRDPGNQHAAGFDPSRCWSQPGWIYALFHFASGRIYVGQTIRHIWLRAREHWSQRKRLNDVLHVALRNEISPFSFVVLPLEKIPSDQYNCPDRQESCRVFRLLATPRERYWVGRLNSMWPRGFNSAYPGRPVSAWCRRVWRMPEANRMELQEEEVDEVGRQVSAWMKRLQSDGSRALLELKNWDKVKLRESLDWIQANIPVAERRANLLAVETTIIEELRDRRAAPPKRQYLKFHFGNQGATYLLLRNVLRDPDVYTKHPHPEEAAAIMVADRFTPQIQAYLCNYAAVAKELDIESAFHDNLQNCQCRKAMWKPNAEDFNGDGHVLTIDSRNLRWPFLRSLVVKGKKFRLETDMDSVFGDLATSLENYVQWYSKKCPDQAAQLRVWSQAVYEHCRENWRRAVQDGKLSAAMKPSGYPALRKTIHEAQEHLVFLHDDRAPHGLVMICKRWYQREMARYLLDDAIFEACHMTSWADIVLRARTFNASFGFSTGEGIVYNYGIWKPKKQKFRFIAGTRSCSKDEQQDLGVVRPSGVPRQPLYDAHKALVCILQEVEKVLKEIDQQRMRVEGIRGFWGIDSVNAFTRLVRSHSDLVVAQGQYTADFCTMYTAFEFDHIILRTMVAVEEAWTYQRRQLSLQSTAPGATVEDLRLGVHGWSLTGVGFRMDQLSELLTFLIFNSFTYNGGSVRRQIKGMPMGIPAAPQIANLACYPVERDHAYRLGPGKSLTVCRYIDDFWSSGVPLPPEEAYGMKYIKTAEGSSVVYLGIKVYIEQTPSGTKEMHTTVYDREFSYPYHIVRYPDSASVAPSQQLGGVIMGRLVHCQETCSHMSDFKESVGSVFRNAMWRGYSRRLIQSVWSRFLLQRWHCDIRTKELRVWFSKIWKFLLHQGNYRAPNPLKPTLPLKTFSRPEEQHSSIGTTAQSWCDLIRGERYDRAPGPL